ncbi:MAG TPA: hypothetical protein VD905_00810 [Flavobacteriales bacterium]|nr:hypothetical protein [Flavobacteriales bacterium]
MKVLKQVSILIVTCSVLVQCSKEKKVERSLYKKEGTWSITSVSWQKVLQDTSGQSVSQGTTANAGTFMFDKDGSGSYNFTVDGTIYNETFAWSVNNTTVSITKVSQNVDFTGGGSIEQIAISFSGDQKDKKNFEIQGSDSRQYASGSISQKVFTGTFSLTKQ